MKSHSVVAFQYVLQIWDALVARPSLQCMRAVYTCSRRGSSGWWWSWWWGGGGSTPSHSGFNPCTPLPGGSPMPTTQHCTGTQKAPMLFAAQEGSPAPVNGTLLFFCHEACAERHTPERIGDQVHSTLHFVLFHGLGYPYSVVDVRLKAYNENPDNTHTHVCELCRPADRAKAD